MNAAEVTMFIGGWSCLPCAFQKIDASARIVQKMEDECHDGIEMKQRNERAQRRRVQEWGRIKTRKRNIPF